MKTFLYKAVKSIIPCVLLTLSIGFCYAFSLFVPEITTYLGCSKAAVQFTFCLNIFWLGMGAAFFGPLVEHHIKIASLTSTLLLFSGFIVSGLGITYRNIWLIYLGSGLLCGLAEGCGYVVPNKNMLLWFGKTKFKGLIMAVSIITFGLGSAVCSWLFSILFPMYGIQGIFYVLGGLYLAPTLIATVLINKPQYAIRKIHKSKSTFKYKNMLSDSFFRKAWMFMFLNISMGLILIGSCATMLKEVNLSSNIVITVMMLCGLFNGAGRLVFPFISDFMKNRLNIWILIIILEVCIMIPSICIYSFIPFTIILINATYGSAFATLPSILNAHYGKSNLSQIHGFCLSSWGMASLFAYICTLLLMTFCTNFYLVTILLLVIYMINLAIVMSMKKCSHNK